MKPFAALFSLALALPAAAFEVVPAAKADLDSLLWQARPILVFAEDPGDPRLATQLERFRKARAALDERDNLVILDTGTGSALRRAYRPGPFTVILVGKDGGEKGRWQAPVEVETLNTLIDAMPMRRQEMRRRGG